VGLHTRTASSTASRRPGQGAEPSARPDSPLIASRAIHREAWDEDRDIALHDRWQPSRECNVSPEPASSSSSSLSSMAERFPSRP